MLNDEQRMFIEDNIKLVHNFCHINHITDEDEIAEAMYKFCEIVEKGYYESKNGAFSTYAYGCLKNHLNNIHRNTQAQKRKVPNDTTLVSINQTVSFDDGESEEFENIVPDDNEQFAEVAMESVLDNIEQRLKHVKTKYKTPPLIVFKEVVKGYKYNNGFINRAEIARKCNCKKQRIDICMKRIQKEARCVLDEDD